MNRNLTRIFLILFATALNSFCIQGQTGRSNYDEEEMSFSDRIFFGGNFGLQFGTITNVELSPIVGYYFTPRLAGGTGIRYEFYRDRRPGFIPFETHIYGGSLFTRLILIDDLEEMIGIRLNSKVFAHAEYEMLSLEKKYFEVPATLEEGRFPLHSVLVGGGLFQPVGRRSGLVMMVLWNLNQTASSPYSNPVIRIGFNF